MHAGEDGLTMIQVVTALAKVEIDDVDGIDLLDLFVCLS